MATVFRICSLALLSFLTLGSCTERKVLEKSSSGSNGAAPKMGNPLLPGGGDILDSTSYNVNTREELESISNQAEGEVFFTDPDNPHADVEGISEAFLGRQSAINRWLVNYNQALRAARDECRPLIIWFHDSAISPKSKQLGDDLLNTSAFNKYCEDRVIRLKVDTGPSVSESSQESARFSIATSARMQHRYGLRHKPSLVVITPHGKVVKRVDGVNPVYGYVGVEDDLKKGVLEAEKLFREYKKKLRTQGFRDWTSANGKIKLFAKVIRFDEKKDMLYLKDFSGRQLKLLESRLCDEDLEYVETKLRTKGRKY